MDRGGIKSLNGQTKSSDKMRGSQNSWFPVHGHHGRRQTRVPCRKGSPLGPHQILPWPLLLVPAPIQPPPLQQALSLIRDLLPWAFSSLRSQPPTAHLPWWSHSHLRGGFIHLLNSVLQPVLCARNHLCQAQRRRQTASRHGPALTGEIEIGQINRKLGCPRWSKG